jgi:hypothetical protein
MAQAFCITQEIRDELEKWDRESLLDAICDDKYEKVLEYSDQENAERAADAERNRLADLPHDVLVNRAFQLAEQNITCDNGGFGYWIDREGHHKIWLPDTD